MCVAAALRGADSGTTGGKRELSGALAIADVLTGRIPAANNDRIQSLPLRNLLFYTQIILGSLALNSAAVRLLWLFFSGYRSLLLSIPLGLFTADRCCRMCNKQKYTPRSFESLILFSFTSILPHKIHSVQTLCFMLVLRACSTCSLSQLYRI